MFVFVGILIMVFLLRELIMLYGSYKQRMVSDRQLNPEFRPFVSIIIPARNEESNIENCIQSIMKSSYDKDRFEIVAVNDRSDDSTGAVLDKLAKKYGNLKIVSISDETAHDNLRGKPGALQAGISASKGEILLMTDADCIVTPGWIETMAAHYQDPDVGLVASFTGIIGDRVFDRVQDVEWIYMCTMGCAGIGINQPLGCYGNNLSVRREVYDRTGGYANIKFSVTEDLALLKAVHSLGKKVKYICNKDSVVLTRPVKNFREYISQHRRWAIGGIDLGWRAALFVISSVAIWLGLLISIWHGNLNAVLALVSARIFGDYLIIRPSTSKIDKGDIRKWIIPSVFFFTLVEILVPVLVLNPRIKWKGQIFKRN